MRRYQEQILIRADSGNRFLVLLRVLLEHVYNQLRTCKVMYRGVIWDFKNNVEDLVSQKNCSFKERGLEQKLIDHLQQLLKQTLVDHWSILEATKVLVSEKHRLEDKLVVGVFIRRNDL